MIKTAMFFNIKRFVSLAAVGTALMSCVGSLEESYPSAGGYIRFQVEGEDLLATKAMSERTSVTGFTCLALKADNSVLVNNVKTTKSSSNEILAGYYWPASGTASFFGVLPNVNMTNSAGTVTFPVGTSSSKLTGSEDYVFASKRGSANGQVVQMTFSHILSNIAGLKVTGAVAGTRTTVTSVTLSHPKYGTYQCASGGDSWKNLGTNETTILSKSFSSTSHSSGAMIEGTETGSSSDNLSIIPGTWTVRIQYSVTAGSMTRNYDKSGSATFVAGKKCTVSTILTNDFNMLDLSVDVLDWDQGNTATAWVEDFPGLIDYNGHDYVDLGLPSGTLWSASNTGAMGYALPQVSWPTGVRTNLSFGDPASDPVAAYLGGGWRIPSQEEATELYQYTRVITARNGEGTYDVLIVSTVNGNSIFLKVGGSYGSATASIMTGTWKTNSSYNAYYIQAKPGYAQNASTSTSRLTIPEFRTTAAGYYFEMIGVISGRM